jgi:putative membrane protein
LSEAGAAVVAERRLHPATLVSRTLRFIPEAAGGLAFYGAVIARAELGQIVALALLGTAVGGVAAWLSWWRFRYGVGEREIVIESGVVSRQRRVIPFERVQDIAIEQRLLARLFGTAHVRIETGGAKADEGHLDSIALADAHALRDVIRGAKSAAATEEAGEAEEPLLFAMDVPRVLFSGLFNFSLVFIAAIFAVLQNAEEIGLIDPWDAAQAAGVPTMRTWILGSLSLLALVLLLGVAAGVVRTFARDYGFRLTRTAAGLRRRRGLVTLSEAVIPIRRMQVARIDSGLVARALGWHRLDFQTLGADPRERGAQVAAPFARMEEVRPILAETGFPDPSGIDDWLRSPRRSILRRGLAPALGGLAALALALALRPSLGIAAAVLIALAAAAPLRWSRHLYRPRGDALFLASGVMKRRLRIMPHERVQAIEVTSGPLQRLLRLATVRLDTAGASARGLAIVDLDRGEAALLAERLLGLFREQRSARRGAPPAGHASASAAERRARSAVSGASSQEE